MALVVADRIKETTTTTGTGTYTLAGAVLGFEAFSSIGDGNTTYYCCTDGTDFEVGIGTYTSSGTTLARTTILQSSNSDSAVNWTAGERTIFVTQPAEKAVYLDASGYISAFDGRNLTNVDAETLDNINSTSFLRNDNGDIAVGSNKITGLATPTANTDAATKAYVDSIASTAIHIHDPVRVERPDGDGNLAGTYNNGTAGVGATLTNNSTQVALSIDGVTLSTNDRVLLYNQTDATENGIYTVTNTGSASTNWVLTRATDADSSGIGTSDALDEGSYFYVDEGNTGAGESYVCNASGTITFGTTEITFAKFGESVSYTGGIGIDINVRDIVLDLSELTTSTSDGDGDFFAVVDSANAQKKLTKANINLSGFNNDSGFLTEVSNLTLSNFAGSTIQLSSESFSDVDTALMTAAAIDDRILSFGYTTNVGDITGVTAGTGLSGGGSSGTVSLSLDGTGTIGAGTYGSTSDLTKIDTITVDAFGRVTAVTTGSTGDVEGVTAGTGLSGGGSSGTVTLNLDFSELTDMTADISGTTEFILQDGTTESRKAASEIKLSAFNNDSGFTTTSGTVTSVGGTGTVNGITLTGTVTSSGNLTLGGTLGSITVSQLAGSALTTSSESFADNDTTLMTSAAINDRIESFGYITSADGGNAQTLDSLDSTQFLRSDQSDTMTGDLTVSGSAHVDSDGTDGPGSGLRVANTEFYDFGNGDPSFRNTNTNTRTVLRVLPNGTGMATAASAFEFFGKDYHTDSTTYHNFRILGNETDDYIIDTSFGSSATPDKSIKFNLGLKGGNYNLGAENILVLSGASATLGNVGIGTDTPSTKLEVAGDLTLTSTDAGATADPSLILHRDSASPADFDVIGNIQFDAENSAGEQTTYAQIYSQIVDQTDGTEDGYLQFWTKVGGTDLVQFRIGFSTSDFYGNVRINPSNVVSDPALIFEGSTSNDFETSVKVVDPTDDQTITLPDASGTVPVFTTAPTGAITDGTDGQVLTTDGSGGLSFTTVSGGGGSSTFTGLSDTPSTYTANKFLKVNSGGTAVEFSDAVGGGVFCIEGERSGGGASANSYFAIGNGAQPNNGVYIPEEVTLRYLALSADSTQTSATMTLYVNGSSSGQSVTLTSQAQNVTSLLNYTIAAGSRITFRMTSGSTNSTTVAVAWFANEGAIGATGPTGATGATGATGPAGDNAYDGINAQTDTLYTAVAADEGKLISLNNASAITFTIPPNSSVSYTVGVRLDIVQYGAGQVTVAGGTGVTVNSTPTLKLRAQYSAASCVKISTDEWLLVGDLAET